MNCRTVHMRPLPPGRPAIDSSGRLCDKKKDACGRSFFLPQASFFPLWQFQVFWPDNFCQHFPDIIIIKLSKTEHSAHAMGKGLLL